MTGQDKSARNRSQLFESSGYSRLRLLDFDDLLLLNHLLDGATIAATAKQLGLTQPAITQRVRKIERVFDVRILQKDGRHVRLTDAGRAICVKSRDALGLMRTVADTGADQFTVVTSHDMGLSLLWPALMDFNESDTICKLHMQLAESQALMANLESGAASAVLSHQGHRGGVYRSIDIRAEEYLFCATPQIADRIKTLEDLRGEVLLERDRSLSSFNHLAAEARAHVRFDSIWYLGSRQVMARAAALGLGVAVLSQYEASSAIAAGKLAVVLPDAPFAEQTVRLIYSPDPRIERAMTALALHLKGQR